MRATASVGSWQGPQSGLRSGDVILSVDGSPIADARELTRRIGALRPGASVELTYLRDGREQRAKLELGSLPNQEQASLDRTPDRSATSSLRLGLQLAPAPGEEGVETLAGLVGLDLKGVLL